MSNPKVFDTMVKQLGSELHHGEVSLKGIPQTLRCVLGENVWGVPMWPMRVDSSTGEVYAFDRFEDFVETPPIRGLGANMKILRSICKDDPVAMDMLDRAVQRSKGRPEENGLNQPIYSSDGERDRSSRNIRRLRKDRPDLHQKVLDKGMTVSEAVVMAGFYPPRVTINLKSPQSAAATIINKATPEFVSELRRLLDEQDN